MENNTIDNSNTIPKQSNQTKSIHLNKNNFEFCYVIGKGGFGKVWKVVYKKTKETFALKEMSKLKVIDKKSEQSINSERTFLSKLYHPFIVNMHYAFQDNENLYLVMDMLSGGDLRYHISRHRKFSEEQTRFFIACMIYSLKYIHENNVIHRDIKPENLVLDGQGYCHITDFGIAKKNMKDNSSETSGTPGYMSPEVMKGKHHSFSVDYFAIGVIGYEFMNGRRPYYGKDRNAIKEQILSKQVKIDLEEIPNGWSIESADFINKLLLRKPEQRLGNSSIDELKDHPWLKYYPWSDLKNKILASPFIPEKRDNFDKHYCESIDRIGEETKMRYKQYLYDDPNIKVFHKFYYNKEENAMRTHKKANSDIGVGIVVKDIQLTPQSSTVNLHQNNNNHKPMSKTLKCPNPNNPSCHPNNANNNNLNMNDKTLLPNKNNINSHSNREASKEKEKDQLKDSNRKDKERPPLAPHHSRPLSYSYSVKEIHQINNNNNNKPASSKFQQQHNCEHSSKKKSNKPNKNLLYHLNNKNLFNLLYHTKMDTNTKKEAFIRSYIRSSSLVNIHHGKNSLKYNDMNKFNTNIIPVNVKENNSTDKKISNNANNGHKLSRVSSASSIFSRASDMNYLYNKIKGASNTNNNKPLKAVFR